MASERSGWGGRNWLMALGLVLSASSLGQGNMEVSYEPVWDGQGAQNIPVVPLRVLLQNPGKDDVVEVSVEKGGDMMRTWVEMPQGAEKSVVFYMSNSGYEPGNLTVFSRINQIKIPIEIFGSGTETQTVKVAYVGDEIGSLGFLRAAGQRSASKPWTMVTYEDYYAQPGDVPDRSVGFIGFDLIVMGDGSERLTDDEVSAIQGAVLGGAKLLFLGGAGKPVLNDARWASMLPVEVGRTSVKRTPAFLGAYAGGVPSSVSWTDFRVRPGAESRTEGGSLVAAWKVFGNGTVGFLAFDPFAGDMRKWDGRKGLSFALDKWMASTATVTPLAGQFWSGQGVDPYTMYSLGQEREMNSVFRVEMPPAWKVGLILGAYVILVVPLNFLFLRKIGRGELAWVTAPLLAAGFAGVFFTFSSSLYETGLSKQTTATILASTGVPHAMVFGDQELFFPGGGRYDLGWDGVEFATRPVNPYEFSGTARTARLDMVDGGTLTAPRLGVTNLSFWNYSFAQRIDWPMVAPGSIQVRREGGSATAGGTLVNTTPYTLLTPMVSVRGVNLVAQPSEVGPGEEIVFPGTKVPIEGGALGSVKLRATLKRPELGAKVGQEVETATTTLIWDVPAEVVR